MNAITVSVSGDTPAEVGARLRALADALTPPTATPPPTTGGLPAVPPSPAPRVCSVHGTPLRFDEWESKAGKQCRAWRCPQATASTDCDIQWSS